ncbi:MAG: hypothetical protein ABJQ29_12820 [Luteolibacter sp.]
MDSSKIKVLLVVVFSAFAALYLGIAAATAQKEAIAWVLGALTIGFVLALGKHVWVLIPICLQLAGNISLIPGSPSPWWGAVGIVGTVFTMRFLLRTQDFQFRLKWMDFAILLQVIAIGQAFVRNPTGLSLLGGDIVGGKPYIIFVFSFAAYALMAVVRTDLRMVKWVVIFSVLMSLADGGLMLASVLVPPFAAAILPIYSGVSFASAYSGMEAADTSEGRLVGGKDIGKALGLAAFTLFRPISTLNPLRPIGFLLMVGSLSLILVSGFRSALVYVAALAVVSSLVRRKYVDLIICGTIFSLMLVGFIMTDTVQKLPFGAQRILSVLPVNVRPGAREDADKSSEWRFEMWRLALTTDRYISNKLLGDGFAFRADELAAMQETAFGTARSTSKNKGQDLMMAKGSYHGFHVEAIRMTGAFGLLCALVGLGIFFRCAWTQIQYFRGRHEWPFILYICIPFLIHPFYLMLIFGAYRMGFPEILVAASMLKLLDNIRLNELAEARRVTANSETEQSQARDLSHGRLPQSAMRTR